ncbi:MAG: glycosyltransferase family 4 protein [Caulobacterales bacterium]
MTRRRRLLIVYWGRRGPIARLGLDMMAAAAANPEVDAWFSASPENELSEALQSLGARYAPVSTYRRAAGALRFDRLATARAALHRTVAEHAIDTVVTLMPHVWTPIAASGLSQLGARHVVVIHDAETHPGDPSGWIARYADTAARHADLVVYLSRAVAGRAEGRHPRSIILFHPLLELPHAPIPQRSASASLRILFFGRILAYKGLDLLIAACEQLRARGRRIDLTVAGEGNLDPWRDRLNQLGAAIQNDWLTEHDLRTLLGNADLVAAPYKEASQSGVVALALGAGVPVLATPVGGLIEQVRNGENALVASAPSADAIAEAIDRVCVDPSLLQRLKMGAARRDESFSARAFLQAIVEAAAKA